MPRTKLPADPATASVVHVIEATGIYTAETFSRIFGLRPSSLRREVREQRLKVHKRCGKYFILGEDVLAWLRSGELPQRRPATASNGGMQGQ